MNKTPDSISLHPRITLRCIRATLARSHAPRGNGLRATIHDAEHQKHRYHAERGNEKEITRLEKEMLQAAKNLEFEKATELRGQLKKLREAVLLSPL